MSADAGFIRGRLVLFVGSEQVEMGAVTLPLKVTKVAEQNLLHLGIGVNLAAVRDDIAAIFASHQEDES